MSEREAAPSVLVTDAARERLRDAVENFPEPIAGVQLSLAGRGPEGLTHRLTLVDEGEEPEHDATLPLGDELTLFIEAANADYLDECGDAGAEGRLLAELTDAYERVIYAHGKLDRETASLLLGRVESLAGGASS